MAIRLPKSPRNFNDEPGLIQWFENLWNYVTGTVATTGDAAATLGSGETYHGVTALTAPRTLTLPPSAQMQDGDEIIIQDESGSASTQTITIATQGSDSLYGSNTITTAYGRRRVIKRGAGKFYSA